MINFIVKDKRPYSYNSPTVSKRKYMAEIVADYRVCYKEAAIPYPAEKLYGLAYYFFRQDLHLDADNLSKPIWDALKGIVYSDDRQIITRSISAINLQENDISQIDFTGLDGSRVSELTNSLLSNDHTLYIECGKVNSRMWNFNLEKTCS